MPATRERFIQLALRPLKDHGQAEEDAAQELTARLAHAGDDPARLDMAAERLAKHSPPPAWRLPAIAGAVILLLAIALASLLPEHWEEAHILARIHQQGGGSQEHVDRMLRSMGPAGEQVPIRNVYYRDKDAFLKEVKALLEQHPRDKAVYRYYALWYRYWSNHTVDPPDFMEKWNELDPGNAIWGINLANSLSERCISRISAGTFAVSDEEVAAKALALLRDAARRDHCSANFARIQELQLASFVPDDTLKSLHLQQDLIERTGSRHEAWLYSISRLVAIQAGRLADKGDKESLRSLIQDYRKVLLLVARDRTAQAGNVITLPRASLPLLKTACSTAGLTEEEEWLDRAMALAPAFRASFAGVDALERQAGALGSNILSPVITAAELKPGRMAEYAVADRFMGVVAALVIFLILAGGSLEMLRRRADARALARGLSPLFRGSDGLWIFAAGIVVPLIWWLAVIRFSPLGGRDIALSYFKLNSYPMLQPWLSQGLGGILLVLVSLYQVSRWRWARRGALLSFSSRGMWIGWTMLILAALFIPIIGGVRYVPKDPHKFILCASAAGAIPLLWLLWRTCMGLFTGKENSLQGLLTLRAMMSGLAVVALLMLAAIPLLRIEERNWMQRDILSRRDPDGSGLTVMERKSYDLMRPELIQALEQKAGPSSGN